MSVKSKFALFATLVLVIVLILAYSFFFSPRARALKHLDYIHDAVTQMHPAVLDNNATAFHAWHSVAYEKTKALLPYVHSIADEAALLNYYFSGYQDPHLAGSLAKTPYKFLESSATWMGWLLKATASGYEVAYSLDDKNYPAVGMELISCDNQRIDEILQKNYAPYFDTRWNILSARTKAAAAFTQNTYFSSVLNRPNYKRCTFQAKNGTQQEYSLQWQTYDPAVIDASQAWRWSPYKFPAAHEFSPKFLWVTASDFQLNSAEAYQHYQQLLQDLKNARDSAIVVFDLRGNGGGSSVIGSSLLNAFFGDDNAAFLENEIATQLGNTDAQFRASWYFYWSYDFFMKKQKAEHGENDETVKFLQNILVAMKKSLDAHEDFFLQSAINPKPVDSDKATPAIPSWKYPGLVVVLTDQNCVSSCLDFVDLIKQVPNKLHLGQPTDADTVYTQIASMWHEHMGEAYSFNVPVKKWSKRLRADSEPYIPDVIYEGNIYDDVAVEKWVFDQIGLNLLR